MKKKIIYTAEQADEVATQLQSMLKGCRVITMSGSLGAGKTTLVRALMLQAGVADGVSSPTFSYVNRYQNKQGEIFYHFDLYRVQTVDDLIALGFDEMLHEPKAQLFIEWPAIAMPLLQDMLCCHITIDYEGLDKRMLTITKKKV